MAIVVQGFAVFLAALFSLAAGHKARVLLAGRAEREPLLRRLHRSSAGAQALLVVGLLAEVLAAVLLILADTNRVTRRGRPPHRLPDDAAGARTA